MLQEAAARYFQKCYDFKLRLERARTGGGFATATWREFVEMGWLAAAIPEAHGGLGFGAVEIALIAEEVGRHLGLEPFTACGVDAIKAIQYVATDAQKDALLPMIAAGERLYAVASSEPEARGDSTRIACRALRSRDGTWRLDGRKSLVIGAGVADRFLVFARTAGAI